MWISNIEFHLFFTECTPVHGPLLISGLGIIALAELLGLVYMKCVGKSTLFLLAYARKMLLVNSYCLGPKKCIGNSKNEKIQWMLLYFLNKFGIIWGAIKGGRNHMN